VAKLVDVPVGVPGWVARAAAGGGWGSRIRLSRGGGLGRVGLGRGGSLGRIRLSRGGGLGCIGLGGGRASGRVGLGRRRRSRDVGAGGGGASAAGIGTEIAPERGRILRVPGRLRGVRRNTLVVIAGDRVVDDVAHGIDVA